MITLWCVRLSVDQPVLVVTAILTFIAVIVYAYQAHWLRQHVKTYQKTERPYLAIESVHTMPIKDKEGVHIYVRYRNLGRSPGIVFEFGYSVEYVPKNSKVVPLRKSGNLKKSSTYTPAQAKEMVSPNAYLDELQDRDKLSRISNDLNIVYRGSVRYRGISGGEWEHSFTSVLSDTKPSQNGWPVGHFGIMTEKGYWTEKEHKS